MQGEAVLLAGYLLAL